MLAEVAAIRGIGTIGRILHFVGLYEFMTRTQFADELVHHGSIVGGETG